MLLIETFPCKDKHEACKREREVYEELDAKMNTLRPYITQEETKEQLKQNYKKYCEKHYQENKDYQKKYREDHKDYQKKYREDRKEEIKKYKNQHYQGHKEEYKEHNKQYGKKYREDHKAELNKKKECDFCAKLISKRNMSRHIKICKCKE